MGKTFSDTQLFRCMQTVILAAGKGTRMRPLTDKVSKPMLPVADRPLVGQILHRTVEAGASRLILVVGDNEDSIQSRFGETYAGVPVQYARQDDQVGTADALRAARPLLSKDPFAVVNGDIMVDQAALNTLFATVPAVGATPVDNPSSYGVLSTNDTGSVTEIIEKPTNPQSNLVNAGVYTFPASVLDDVDSIEESTRGEYELTDLLAKVLDVVEVKAVTFDRWLDVGRPWELLEAVSWRLEELSPQINGEVHASADITGPVIVEEGAVIRAGVSIDGPVLLKSGSTVGPNAYIRGSSVISEGATVGHAVEIKNSILYRDATVGHQSYVGDSILAPGVNLGAGTNIANLRHDGKPIKSYVKGDLVSTGRRKYGAVLGPMSKTGINTSIYPGAVLDTDATTLPGEIVTGD